MPWSVLGNFRRTVGFRVWNFFCEVKGHLVPGVENIFKNLNLLVTSGLGSIFFDI
jgi:hypothetical protein